MSDPNEPRRPEDPSDGSGSGWGGAPPPPDGDVPPPPPPPPAGDNPYGAAGGGGGYGDAGYGGSGGYGDGGGYGAQPPNPYGQPDPNAYSPTDAVSFGWRHFTSSPATLLVPTLVIGVAILVVSYLVQVIVAGGMTDSDSSLSTVLLAAAISSAITTLVASVLSAGLYKGGFAVADGRGFSLGQLFEGWDKLQVFIAAVIIALLTLVGTALCYFPALLVAYFTQFTFPYIVDKHMSATDAISASFRLCTHNLGPTILWYLLALLCLIAGAIVCLVGLLVAVPVVLGGLAYTFRRLHGEPVVQPAARTA